MQICDQVGNTLLHCTDHFAEDAALFRRIDLRLIGSGEVDVDDLLLRGLAQSQLLDARCCNRRKIDLAFVFALQQQSAASCKLVEPAFQTG